MNITAFHGSQATKDQYLARVRAHRLADQLVKGIYWEDGKGCAVGCTVHSSSHSDYESELGISRVLARLEDKIFENLPNDLAILWPERFLSAIEPGTDVTIVWRKFLLWVLDDAEHGTLRLCSPKSAEATKKVIELYKREIGGEVISCKEYRVGAADAAAAAAYDAAAAAAADAADAAAYDAAAAAAAAYDAAAYDAAAAAAYDAAYAAADAADAAADAADADAADAAAYAVADAAAYAAAADAVAATYAADAAAYAAVAAVARQEHFIVMSDKLIQLLEECRLNERVV